MHGILRPVRSVLRRHRHLAFCQQPALALDACGPARSSVFLAGGLAGDARKGEEPTLHSALVGVAPVS